MLDATVYDLIIIGGGPSGMISALYAARQKLNFLLITKNVGGLANNINEISTQPGIPYISGFGLITSFADQLKENKVPIVEDETVKSIRASGRDFVITTETSEYVARSVIVATGRGFKRSGIKGEKKFEGRGVSFCAICDGEAFADKTVAVIGGGHSGIFATLFMLKLARKIYLIEEKVAIEHSGKVTQVSQIVSKSPKVTIMSNAKAVEVIGTDTVTCLKIIQMGEEKLLKVDAVFVQVGYSPNTHFLTGICELNDKHEIVIDKLNMTSLPGLFAAGDVTDVPEKQVIVAFGEGAKAALAATLYLEENGSLTNSESGA